MLQESLIWATLPGRPTNRNKAYETDRQDMRSMRELQQSGRKCLQADDLYSGCDCTDAMQMCDWAKQGVLGRNGEKIEKEIRRG